MKTQFAASLFALSLAAAVGSCSVGNAAQIGPGDRGLKSFDDNRIDCDFRLSGEIAEGDAKALETLFKTRSVGTYGSVLCFNSPGGSYDEGLKIAELLIHNSVTTAVEANAYCYSACAIAFMAGTEISESYMGPKRRLDLLGTLGFHAPT
jgi:hypothetical protein